MNSLQYFIDGIVCRYIFVRVHVVILWTDFCLFPLPLHFLATRLALHDIIILMTDKVDDKAEGIHCWSG